MFVCLDVDYRAAFVQAACVGFERWSDSVSSLEVVHRSADPPADYVPGQFYLRELPHLTAVLNELPSAPALVVIDGHVWLDQDKPGLGAHLHEALGGKLPVIGAAKRPYRSATRAIAVHRGQSRHPLYVSAVGVGGQEAADHVRSMHGPYRIPTLLKRVDRLSREP